MQVVSYCRSQHRVKDVVMFANKNLRIPSLYISTGPPSRLINEVLSLSLSLSRWGLKGVERAGTADVSLVEEDDIDSLVTFFYISLFISGFPSENSESLLNYHLINKVKLLEVL